MTFTMKKPSVHCLDSNQWPRTCWDLCSLGGKATLYWHNDEWLAPPVLRKSSEMIVFFSGYMKRDFTVNRIDFVLRVSSRRLNQNAEVSDINVISMDNIVCSTQNFHWRSGESPDLWKIIKILDLEGYFDLWLQSWQGKSTKSTTRWHDQWRLHSVCAQDGEVRDTRDVLRGSWES